MLDDLLIGGAGRAGLGVGGKGVAVLPCAVLLVFGVVKAVVGEDDFGVVAVAAEWVGGIFAGGGQVAACLVILGLR